MKKHTTKSVQPKSQKAKVGKKSPSGQIRQRRARSDSKQANVIAASAVLAFCPDMDIDAPKKPSSS